MTELVTSLRYSLGTRAQIPRPLLPSKGASMSSITLCLDNEPSEDREQGSSGLDDAACEPRGLGGDTSRAF